MYKKISNVITENLIGQLVKVYNGQKFVTFMVVEGMLGHVLGEYVLTKKLGGKIQKKKKKRKEEK